MEKFSPTNKKPSPMGKKLDKDFNKKFKMAGMNINEVDGMLTEKEESLKKKIWDLSKMETLVHSDPKLSSKYNEMAEDGEERFGYHYNETIMNILFNDYVLNSAQYLQKYKNAIPSKKKRRDKSGIDQLQNKLQGKEKEDGKDKKEKKSKKDESTDIEETTGAASSGAFTPSLGFKKAKDNVYEETEEIDETTTTSSAGDYAYVGPFRKRGKNHPADKPMWDGGEIIGENHLINPDVYKNIFNMLNESSIDNIDLGKIETPFLQRILSDLMNGANWKTNDSVKSIQRELRKRGILKNPTNEGFLDNIDLSRVETPFLQRILSDLMNSANWKTNNSVKSIQGELRKRGVLKTPTNEMEIYEHHANTKNEKIDYILSVTNKSGEALSSQELMELPDETIDLMYKDLEKAQGVSEGEAIDEKSKSKAQQRFMGMVRAYQKGEMDDASASVKKAADSMSAKDAEDFASTKHDELPEKIEEASKTDVSFGEVQKLANEIDNSEIGDEDEVIENFLEGKEMSIAQLKWFINKFIDSGRAKQFGDDEYYKIEYVVSVINDMLDQKSDAKRQADKELAKREFERTPYGKDMLSQEMSEAADTEDVYVKYHSEKPDEVPFKDKEGNEYQEVWAVYPDGKKDIGYYSFREDLVYSWDWFRKNILGEGMISGNETTMAMDANNPTSMANTMKEGEEDNQLRDFGKSESGVDNDNNPWDSQKTKRNIGGKKMEDIDKPVMTEDGHCRADERPVLGKIAGEKGSCEKKDKSKRSKSEKEANKFNEKVRKERESKKEKNIKMKKDELKKELEDSEKQTKKLKEMFNISEDKRPSALVQLDRLHKENEKNFDGDMSDSGTAEVAKKVMDGEDMAKDQYTDVPENPYELAEKIEKEKMKEHDYDSFDNVGNSTNDNNKEIPKRNATDDEAEDIMKDRGLGMQDIVYDNKPDQRFEERMEKDMGEDIYKQRQEKMAHRSEAPMYNKDSQPIEDGVEKDQYEKNINKYNSRRGVNESKVTGKYKDEFGNTKFIDFKINETVETTNVEGMIKLNLSGLGNTYTQDVKENSEMRDMISAFEYYLNANDNNVVKISKKQTLSESKEVTAINEELEKMKKLWNYSSEKHLNTKGIKKNFND
jgi:hypothetical protein